MLMLKIARLLDDLADLSKRPPVVRNAAWRIWLVPFQLGLGKWPKTREEALEGLKQVKQFLSGEEYTRARELIRGLRDEQLIRGKPRIARIPSSSYLEYRGGGRISYVLKKPGKRNPADDLSQRVWEARCALVESGCPNANQYIADVLNKLDLREYWTPPKVESRLKAFKGVEAEAWPADHWRFFYALQHADTKERPLPEKFEFARWEPSKKKRG